MNISDFEGRDVVSELHIRKGKEFQADILKE